MHWHLRALREGLSYILETEGLLFFFSLIANLKTALLFFASSALRAPPLLTLVSPVLARSSSSLSVAPRQCNDGGTDEGDFLEL